MYGTYWYTCELLNSKLWLIVIIYIGKYIIYVYLWRKIKIYYTYVLYLMF